MSHSLFSDLIHSLVTEVCVDDEYDEVSDDVSDVSSTITSTTSKLTSKNDDVRMSLLPMNRGNSVIIVERRQQPKRSISFDLLKETIVDVSTGQQQLSPPTPFADEMSTSTTATTTTTVSTTLPRPPSRTTSRGSSFMVPKSSSHQQQQRPLSLAVNESTKSTVEDSRRQCRTLPRNCCRAIPPPPQYKGVHFAPGVEPTTETDRSTTPPLVIPTEGLPTGPARFV